MTLTAQVTATSLNLRASPNGTILAVLPRGTVLNIVNSGQGDWTQVSTTVGTPIQYGWVSTNYIALPTGNAPAVGSNPLPIADDDNNRVTVANGRAIGPNGTPFARCSGPGFATSGLTMLDTWLASETLARPPSASRLRVIKAVSINEGRLEAINSYDDAHLSVGMLQWTMGVDDEPGELAAVISKFKQSAPSRFQDCFGRYGLDVKLSDGSGFTGYFSISGREVRAADDKDEFRKAEWAYRFWRATQSNELRQAELEMAVGRIDRFVASIVANFKVGQWLSSEYGVALMLDEHVNRPGHVPGTLLSAVTALQGGGPALDPTGWSSDDELKLIQQYLAERAKTTMTDSDGRAKSIEDEVSKGLLSDRRASFQT